MAGLSQGKCLNLVEQIELFGRIVKGELPKYYKNTENVTNYLSKSLFVISIGSNDYINNYLETNIYDTSKRYTPQSFASLLISNLSQQLQVQLLMPMVLLNF